MTTASDLGPERLLVCAADAQVGMDSIHRRRRHNYPRAASSHERASLKNGTKPHVQRSGVSPFSAQLELFCAARPADPLAGLAVKLPDTCGKCGQLVAIVGPGKPPHCASLLCQSCGLHRGWISRANYTFLNEIINKFGAPSEPIVFRSRSTKPEQNGDGISVVQDDVKKEQTHAGNF
jgi:hypothetical protein